MYDIDALTRLIKKEGINSVISEFISPDFPASIKDCLAKDYVFIGSCLNIPLIYSLAKPNSLNVQ